MKKILLICLAAICLASCAKQGTRVQVSDDKEDFNVMKLFVVGNDTIYRFWDHGNPHYFKSGSGTVMSTISTGKTTRPEEIE